MTIWQVEGMWKGEWKENGGDMLEGCGGQGGKAGAGKVEGRERGGGGKVKRWGGEGEVKGRRERTCLWPEARTREAARARLLFDLKRLKHVQHLRNSA